MAPTLAPGDTVRATNLGDTPFTVTYNSKSHKLSPGKATFIPVEAAILWFGDPRSIEGAQSYRDEAGAPVFVPERENEVRRLSVKYGHQTGNVYDYLSGKTGSDLVPKVEIATVDGEVIKTVLDDPTGESVIPITQTATERDSLMAIIERQQQQINMLLGQAGLAGGDPIGPVVTTFHESVSDIPEDDSYLQGGPVTQFTEEPPTDNGGLTPVNFPNLP